MACEILNNYYPIVIKFLGYLPLSEDASAIDLGLDRSIPLVVHAPRVGHNKLDCSSVCEWNRNFQRCSFKEKVFINIYI